MDSWVWVFLGFAAGLVVAAIVILIFRKDTSTESQQAEKYNDALLAKDEMKSAILQRKLDIAESELAEQRLSLDANYQKKLTAVETRHRDSLLQLEKQFAALDAAFAAQIAVDSGLEPEIVVEDFGSDIAEEVNGDDDSELMQALAVKAAVAELELLASAHATDDDLYLALEEEVAREVVPTANVVTIPSIDTIEPEEPESEMDAAGVSEPFEIEPLQIDAAAKTVLAVEAHDTAEEIWVTSAPKEDTDRLTFNWKDVSSNSEKDANEVVGLTHYSTVDGSDDDCPGEGQRDQDLTLGSRLSIVAETEDLFEDFSLQEAENKEVVNEQQPTQAREIHSLPADSEEEDEAAGDLPAAATSNDLGAEVIVEVDTSGPAELLEDQFEVDEKDAHEDRLPVTAAAVAVAIERENEPALQPKIAAAVPSIVAVNEHMEPAAAKQVPESDLAAVAWAEDTNMWRGEYFNNLELDGDPDLVREDLELAFDWGLESPAPEIQADGFSVRWQKTADLPPGLYLFSVTCSDGAKLWVEGRLVISAWYDHPRMTFRREMQLPGGPVHIRLEYYDKDSLAIIRLSWRRIG